MDERKLRLVPRTERIGISPSQSPGPIDLHRWVARSWQGVRGGGRMLHARVVRLRGTQRCRDLRILLGGGGGLRLVACGTS